MKRNEENTPGRRARAAGAGAEVHDRPEGTGVEAVTVPAARSRTAPPDPGHGGHGGGGPSGPSGPSRGDEIRERMAAAVNGFVDDPGKAVGEADLVAEEVVRTLIEGVEARRSELRSAWEGGADTENLRVALRGYRAFVEEILDGRPR
ncbi:hypothetical protein ACOQFV_02885 [Nocardiopsis changdeensis]|uniref:Uncharacterized protein n=1 Tax=Nocardiopsis changdeensis TaxID=2831969 RepID=A0ABX8BKE8_9ACTN|nr:MULTISPECIES: hypothetical protein [Nocardiopsis]QUX22571.1 hypothetical protein KGD84_30460 [Nocardiopsis changdeensis]QYX38512.1 hypothetical protein K1J57_07840 [Nocardiopsis sp. MT53]